MTTGKKQGFWHRLKNMLNARILKLISMLLKKNKSSFWGDYPAISSNIKDDFNSTDLMFFDYPATLEEFTRILKQKAETGTSKIHLMKEETDYNIENYIKQLIGMLKYATNNKEGRVSIKGLAQMIGVSENFYTIRFLIYLKH